MSVARKGPKSEERPPVLPQSQLGARCRRPARRGAGPPRPAGGPSPGAHLPRPPLVRPPLQLVPSGPPGRSADASRRQDFWEAFYGGVDYTGADRPRPVRRRGHFRRRGRSPRGATVGVDIDPVACAITRFELRAAEPPTWCRAGRAAADVGAAAGPLLPHDGPRRARSGRSCTPSGYSWSAAAAATKRRGPPALPARLRGRGHRQWAFCRSCHAVRELDREAKRSAARPAAPAPSSLPGPVRHGRLTCPDCQAERRPDRSRRPDRQPAGLAALRPGNHPRRTSHSDPLPMTEHGLSGRDRRGPRCASGPRSGRSAGGRTPDGWRWIPGRADPGGGSVRRPALHYGYRALPRAVQPPAAAAPVRPGRGHRGVDGPDPRGAGAGVQRPPDHQLHDDRTTPSAGGGWPRCSPSAPTGTSPGPSRSTPGWTAPAAAPSPTRCGRSSGPSSSPGPPRWPTSTAGSSAPARWPRTAAASRDPATADSRNSPARRGPERRPDPHRPALLRQHRLRRAVRLLPAVVAGVRAGHRAPGEGRAALPANLAARGRAGTATGRVPAGAGRLLRPDAAGAQGRRPARLQLPAPHRRRPGTALASALAAGGWRPVQVFPLLGNSTAGLHQHAGTILGTP